MKRAALLALAACACAPEQPPASAKVALDCAAPFETLKARVLGQQLTPAPKDGSPYLFYSTADAQTSYVITEESASAHPAILMQEVKDGAVVTTGCRYGDAKAYDDLLKYLESLKAWRRSGAKS